MQGTQRPPCPPSGQPHQCDGARLRFYPKNESPVTIELQVGEEIMIGSSRSCDIQFKDPLISRRHCVVHLDPQKGLMIVDLWSANGIYVNDAKVFRKAPLKPKVPITIGSCIAKVIH